jgi:dTMP kinase
MFITFEGPEGAGKTTAISAISEHLRARGESVLVTREPGSGEFGKQIREILLHGGSMPAESELFLFLADRSNHVRNVIQPALAKNQIVLCDRYADSTYVYQSIVRGLDPDFVRAANNFATGNLKPDQTFLLDLAPEIGLARIQSKDRMDSEPIEFHQNVRVGFLELASAEPDRWQIVNATMDKESIVASFFTWFEANY